MSDEDESLLLTNKEENFKKCLVETDKTSPLSPRVDALHVSYQVSLVIHYRACSSVHLGPVLTRLGLYLEGDR